MLPDCTTESRWQRIRTAMERNRALLEHQGTITAKTVDRSTVYVLRFCVRQGSRRTQRSIYLGADPELIQRAQALLSAIREPKRWGLEIAAAADSLGSIVSRLRRRLGRRTPL